MDRVKACCDIDITPKYDGENVTVFFVDGGKDLLELALAPEEARVLGELLLLSSKLESDGSCFGMRTILYYKGQNDARATQADREISS